MVREIDDKEGPFGLELGGASAPATTSNAHTAGGGCAALTGLALHTPFQLVDEPNKPCMMTIGVFATAPGAAGNAKCARARADAILQLNSPGSPG